jgi:hypothetical protein
MPAFFYFGYTRWRVGQRRSSVMKIPPIIEALALTAMLVVSSCISFDDHDDKPATTTTITKETVVPDPLNHPGVTQTTQTTITRSR